MSYYYPAGTHRLPGEEVMQCENCERETDPLDMFTDCDEWEMWEGQHLCPDCLSEVKDEETITEDE